MSNLNKLDFTSLDTTGNISAIREPPAAAVASSAVAAIPAATTGAETDDAPARAAQSATVAATIARVAAEELEAKNVKAIILMIRHMDESLQSE
ncbi:hypothetical protein M0R45_017023 [Rubus argutus]|uniref:Uncharacterized protein n=1 Tax=Rubus argutus TaxID=59490 RepID=A0AAW1XUV1_RUBAR